MKILMLLNDDRNALGWSYARALMAMGHTVTVFDPTARLAASRLWRSRVGRRLLERQILRQMEQQILTDVLAQGSFDALFVPKAAWSLPGFWTAYKAERSDTIMACYNADDPITSWSRGSNRPWVTEAIACYDLYITYNQSLLEPIRMAGAKAVLHLPFAWDREIHPMEEFDDRADVIFIGNSDCYREAWLTALVEHPVARNWRIEVYGLWHKVQSARLRAAIQPVQITGPEMAQMTAGARVTLNILRRQNEGSHNMRTFETPGCGGVLASQFSPEQDAVFPDGKAAIYFTSFEDMAPKLAPFIADLDRLAAIRAEARMRIQNETYADRAQVLVQALQDMRAERQPQLLLCR
jgi:spore maturation protein CgeB